MIRKVERYIVDDKEFNCLRDAKLQAAENLANFIRPLIYSYNSATCLDSIMDCLLNKDERVKLKWLLNDIDYEEDCE